MREYKDTVPSPEFYDRPFGNPEYAFYWGVQQLVNPLRNSLIVGSGATLVLSMIDLPINVKIYGSVVALAVALAAFGRVPSWANIQPEQQEPQEQDEDETEDKREFIGWNMDAVEKPAPTHTRLLFDTYTPPVPLAEARSYALALVNNRFVWIAERSLHDYKARISGPNYRRLRADWISREWATETGDRQTIIVCKSMIRRIAFEEPR